MLEKEKERHRCALKLLPFFFTSEELSKQQHRGNAQQTALKVLVFSQFPLKSNTEKDKVWKLIKSKIDSKCPLSKHISKHAGEREN